MCCRQKKAVLKCRGAGVGVVENIKQVLSNLTSELINAFVMASGEHTSSDGPGRVEQHETTKTYICCLFSRRDPS